MEREGKKGTVCVTGGTGFIASWLIKKLLEQNYIVRTTVRSYPDNKKDLSFLTTLPGASQNLKIYGADLSNPESFDPVIHGCIGVFHVAHPIEFNVEESEEVKTQRAINATIAILKSCQDSKTVKRVVYTSSASALLFNNSGLDVVDENQWSDPDIIRKMTNDFWASYMVSKTLTEQAAFDFAQKNGIDFVSISPVFVNGPFVCPRVPDSVHTSMSMIFGDKDQYKTFITGQMVHVDDVANAHIFLLEYPDAKGRYNCSAVDLTSHQLSEFLSRRYPQYPIPTQEELKGYESYSNFVPKLSTKKLLETGFRFKYGLEEMYDDAIKCCKEKGFL